MAASGSVVTYTLSEAVGSRWLEWAGFIIFIVAIVGFPISLGIAIVRYRLYEIDTLINRTLVYGSLTAMLVALYFGGIVVLQSVFVALTGQKSTLAVVASTLLIAALFQPLRRRIQSFIDRRFYRSKYDARKTLEAFSAQGRDGPECAERRPGRGGEGDDATRSRLAVVASRGVTERHAGRLVAPIHPSAWKWNSANFALTEFYEVRMQHYA
jgi:hypothetical protein